MNASTVSAPFFAALVGVAPTFRDRESLICTLRVHSGRSQVGRDVYRSGCAQCIGPCRDAATVRRPGGCPLVRPLRNTAPQVANDDGLGVGAVSATRRSAEKGGSLQAPPSERRSPGPR